MFGDQVRIAGGSNPDGSVQIAIDGRATVEGMRRMFDHPWYRRLSGSSRYTAQLTVKEGRTQISLDSMLEGVSSSLPPPLAKSAAEALALRVEMFPGDGRDRISIALGPPSGRIVSAEFLRAHSAGRHRAAGAARAHCAQSGRGRPVRIPERRGTTVRGSLPALDLDRWLPLLGEVADGPSGADGVSYDIKVGVAGCARQAHARRSRCRAPRTPRAGRRR